MREFDGYLKEDIDELERLKKKIPNDREFSMELINYKEPVSYTHLDVYKRQFRRRSGAGERRNEG